MIKCKKLKAIIPEGTCVARQKIINRVNGRSWKGVASVVLTCRGCEIGLRLLKEHEMSPEKIVKKTCVACKKSYPATGVFFEPASRSNDGLRLACRECTNKERGIEFSFYGCQDLAQTPSEHQVGTKSTPPKEPAVRKFLQINLQKAPELWGLLEDDANENLRTPAAQALWLLKEALI